MTKKSHRFTDITGQKFGRLSVLRVGPKHPKSGKWQWYCLCDCGKEILVNSAYHLTGGNTNSCGCYHIDRISEPIHGCCGDALYRRWLNIKTRCTNPNVTSFKTYGARGIKLHTPWSDSFSKFREDLLKEFPDLYQRFKDGYTLDRIDNDRDYEPGNIRLLTRAENNKNRTSTHKIDFMGIKYTLKEWCSLYRLDPKARALLINSGDILGALELSPEEYKVEVLPNRYYIVTKLSKGAVEGVQEGLRGLLAI